MREVKKTEKEKETNINWVLSNKPFIPTTQKARTELCNIKVWKAMVDERETKAQRRWVVVLAQCVKSET